jgi:hypothetical protein
MTYLLTLLDTNYINKRNERVNLHGAASLLRRVEPTHLVRPIPSCPGHLGNHTHQRKHLDVIYAIVSLQYSQDDVKCLVKITDCHKSSARYCHFNPSGTRIYEFNIVLATCSEDKRLGFIDSTGKIAHIIKKAH